MIVWIVSATLALQVDKIEWRNAYQAYHCCPTLSPQQYDECNTMHVAGQTIACLYAEHMFCDAPVIASHVELDTTLDWSMHPSCLPSPPPAPPAVACPDPPAGFCGWQIDSDCVRLVPCDPGRRLFVDDVYRSVTEVRWISLVPSRHTRMLRNGGDASVVYHDLVRFQIVGMGRYGHPLRTWKTYFAITFLAPFVYGKFGRLTDTGSRQTDSCL